MEVLSQVFVLHPSNKIHPNAQRKTKTESWPRLNIRAVNFRFCFLNIIHFLDSVFKCFVKSGIVV